MYCKNSIFPGVRMRDYSMGQRHNSKSCDADWASLKHIKNGWVSIVGDENPALPPLPGVLTVGWVNSA